MITKDYVFFWGGTFSQWAPSEFIIDGVKYVTAEQYMMAKKALLFKDQESYESIMRTSDPRTQKAFGRKVKGFNADVWNVICRDVVYQANLAKFTQNPKMLED